MRIQEIADAYDREKARDAKRSIFKGRKCAYDKDEVVKAIVKPEMKSPKKQDGCLSQSAHLRFLQQKIEQSKYMEKQKGFSEFLGNYHGLGTRNNLRPSQSLIRSSTSSDMYKDRVANSTEASTMQLLQHQYHGRNNTNQSRSTESNLSSGYSLKVFEPNDIRQHQQLLSQQSVNVLKHKNQANLSIDRKNTKSELMLCSIGDSQLHKTQSRKQLSMASRSLKKSMTVISGRFPSYGRQSSFNTISLAGSQGKADIFQKISSNLLGKIMIQ